MINLKACSRCGGDMMLEEVLGDKELVCLQCGHRSVAPEQSRVPYAITTRRPVLTRKAA